MRAVVEEQGWSVGEGPVYRALAPLVSLRLVREALAELKRGHKKGRLAVQREHRRSIAVHARDALWAQDATHVGRDVHGTAILAEVIRDVASTRTIEIALRPAARAEDVIAALERARRTRGGLPYVWATDNGPAYVFPEVAAYLARNDVVHLLSLPRTPQHNAWAERGMRDLKAEAELDGLRDEYALEQTLLQARDRLDRHRLRRSRGWRTAVQADAQAPAAAAVVDRADFYTATRCAVRRAVLDSCSKREHRRAAREAVLLSMQRFELITRTREGEPMPLAKSYRV